MNLLFFWDIYKTFGFEDFHIELSTRPEKYIGDIEVWDRAEKALENVLQKKLLYLKF